MWEIEEKISTLVWIESVVSKVKQQLPGLEKVYSLLGLVATLVPQLRVNTKSE